MQRKTDGGEHTDPKTIHGRDIEYAGIEFIPSKEFIKEDGKNCGRYAKAAAGSTFLNKILQRNKTRFRPTALACQGGCSKI